MTDETDLDGHTMEELADYLDRGRQPYDASIEGSPACRLALDSLERLHRLTDEMVASDGESESSASGAWMADILRRIATEATSGREVPLPAARSASHHTISEGAVRALVRRAGDGVGDLIVGSVRLVGDLDAPGAPVVVTVEVNVLEGAVIPTATERLRSAVLEEVSRQTGLVVSAIDIVVRDITLRRSRRVL
jgi:hypothetical protein